MVFFLLAIVLILVINFQLVKNSKFNQLNQIVFGLIVEESDQIFFVKLNTNENVVSLIEVPSNLKIDLVHGYGTYQLGVVPQLGDQENLGLDLFVDSLSNTLGVPFVGAARIDNWTNWEQLSVNEVVSQLPVSLSDRLWLKQKLEAANQEIVISLTESNTLEKSTRIDGEDEYTMTANSSSLLAKSLGDPLLMRQSLEMAIVNATTHSGLASTVSEKMKLAGFDVINVSDQVDKLDTSIILISQEESQNIQLITTLTTITGIPVKVGNEVESKYRAHVVILLGNDYWQFLNEKPKP